jgi:transcriptional regulator with XRE-family HTH domain
MDIMLCRILELIGNEHGSTKRLATYLGISPNIITDWKAGRIKSYIKYATQIAEFYGVSLDSLYGAGYVQQEKEMTNEMLQLECECCRGDEALYWKNIDNNAFIDNNGEILVTVCGNSLTFTVKKCPNCGREF